MQTDSTQTGEPPMTTDNSRAEFEKWWKDEACNTKEFMASTRHDAFWLVWQASRAAPDAVIERLVEATNKVEKETYHKRECQECDTRYEKIWEWSQQALAAAEAYRRGE